MDNACSNHMIANLEAFVSLDRSVKSNIKMANGTICKAQDKGMVKVRTYSYGLSNSMDDNPLLYGTFSDSDWVGCLDDRKNTT